MTSNDSAKMDIDLDKLEQVARAADSHSENIGEREWYSSDTNMAIFPPDPDLSLIAELAPAVVLELVRRLRAAEAQDETIAVKAARAAVDWFAENGKNDCYGRDWFPVEPEFVTLARQILGE